MRLMAKPIESFKQVEANPEALKNFRDLDELRT
jgi:hypothetical protein